MAGRLHGGQVVVDTDVYRARPPYQHVTPTMHADAAETVARLILGPGK